MRSLGRQTGKSGPPFLGFSGFSTNPIDHVLKNTVRRFQQDQQYHVLINTVRIEVTRIIVTDLISTRRHLLCKQAWRAVAVAFITFDENHIHGKQYGMISSTIVETVTS